MIPIWTLFLVGLLSTLLIPRVCALVLIWIIRTALSFSHVAQCLLADVRSDEIGWVRPPHMCGPLSRMVAGIQSVALGLGRSTLFSICFGGIVCDLHLQASESSIRHLNVKLNRAKNVAQQTPPPEPISVWKLSLLSKILIPLLKLVSLEVKDLCLRIHVHSFIFEIRDFGLKLWIKKSLVGGQDRICLNLSQTQFSLRQNISIVSVNLLPIDLYVETKLNVDANLPSIAELIVKAGGIECDLHVNRLADLVALQSYMITLSTVEPTHAPHWPLPRVSDGLGVTQLLIPAKIKFNIETLAIQLKTPEDFDTPDFGVNIGPIHLKSSTENEVLKCSTAMLCETSIEAVELFGSGETFLSLRSIQALSALPCGLLLGKAPPPSAEEGGSKISTQILASALTIDAYGVVFSLIHIGAKCYVDILNSLATSESPDISTPPTPRTPLTPFSNFAEQKSPTNMSEIRTQLASAPGERSRRTDVSEIHRGMAVEFMCELEVTRVRIGACADSVAAEISLKCLSAGNANNLGGQHSAALVAFEQLDVDICGELGESARSRLGSAQLCSFGALTVNQEPDGTIRIDCQSAAATWVDEAFRAGLGVAAIIVDEIQKISVVLEFLDQSGEIVSEVSSNTSALTVSISNLSVDFPFKLELSPNGKDLKHMKVNANQVDVSVNSGRVTAEFFDVAFLNEGKVFLQASEVALDGVAASERKPQSLHVSGSDLGGHWSPALQISLLKLIKDCVASVVNLKAGIYKLSGEERRAPVDISSCRGCHLYDDLKETPQTFLGSKDVLPDFRRWYHFDRAPYLPEPFMLVTMEITNVHLDIYLYPGMSGTAFIQSFCSDCVPHQWVFRGGQASLCDRPFAELECLRINRKGFELDMVDADFTEEMNFMTEYLDQVIEIDGGHVWVDPSLHLGDHFHDMFVHVRAVFATFYDLRSIDSLCRERGGEGYESAPYLPYCGVYTRFNSLKISIPDHPLESFLQRMRGVWESECRARARREEVFLFRIGVLSRELRRHSLVEPTGDHLEPTDTEAGSPTGAVRPSIGGRLRMSESDQLDMTDVEDLMEELYRANFEAYYSAVQALLKHIKAQDESCESLLEVHIGKMESVTRIIDKRESDSHDKPTMVNFYNTSDILSTLQSLDESSMVQRSFTQQSRNLRKKVERTDVYQPGTTGSLSFKSDSESKDTHEDVAALDPMDIYNVLTARHMTSTVHDMRVNLRGFACPLSSVKFSRMSGLVVLAQHRSLDVFSLVDKVPIGCAEDQGGYPYIHMKVMNRSFVPLKTFFDMNMDIVEPVSTQAPGYSYAINDLVRVATDCFTPGMLDPMHRFNPWDLARYLLHGRATVNVDGLSVKVLSDLEDSANCLELSLSSCSLAYCCSAMSMDADEILVTHESAEVTRTCLVSVPRIEIAAQWSWDFVEGKSAFDHYVYPIVSQKHLASEIQETLQITPFHSTGLAMQLSLSILNSVSLPSVSLQLYDDSVVPLIVMQERFGSIPAYNTRKYSCNLLDSHYDPVRYIYEPAARARPWSLSERVKSCSVPVVSVASMTGRPQDFTGILTQVELDDLSVGKVVTTLWKGDTAGPASGVRLVISRVRLKTSLAQKRSEGSPRSSTLDIESSEIVLPLGDMTWVVARTCFATDQLKLSVVCNQHWVEREQLEDQRTHMFKGVSERCVVVHCYENQRYFLGQGWISKLLPTDRSPWSDENGVVALDREISFILPSDDWEWTAPWEVDHRHNQPGSVDVHGWEYAHDFPRKYCSRQSWCTNVRRRRWIRIRRLRTAFTAKTKPEESESEEYCSGMSTFVSSISQVVYSQGRSLFSEKGFIRSPALSASERRSSLSSRRRSLKRRSSVFAKPINLLRHFAISAEERSEDDSSRSESNVSPSMSLSDLYAPSAMSRSLSIETPQDGGYKDATATGDALSHYLHRITIQDCRCLLTLEVRDTTYRVLQAFDVNISEHVENDISSDTVPDPSSLEDDLSAILIEPENLTDSESSDSDRGTHSEPGSPTSSVRISGSPSRISGSPSRLSAAQAILQGGFRDSVDQVERERLVVQELLLVEIVRMQLNVESTATSGRMVVGISQCLAEGRCLWLEERKNRLEFKCVVQNVQTFVAPTDVDVGAGVAWLETAEERSHRLRRSTGAFRRAPSGALDSGGALHGGVLKAVMAPAMVQLSVDVCFDDAATASGGAGITDRPDSPTPAAQGTILAGFQVRRAALSVPAVQVSLDSPQLQILSGVVDSVLAKPLPDSQEIREQVQFLLDNEFGQHPRVHFQRLKQDVQCLRWEIYRSLFLLDGVETDRDSFLKSLLSLPHFTTPTGALIPTPIRRHTDVSALETVLDNTLVVNETLTEVVAAQKHMRDLAANYSVRSGQYSALVWLLKQRPAVKEDRLVRLGSARVDLTVQSLICELIEQEKCFLELSVDEVNSSMVFEDIVTAEFALEVTNVQVLNFGEDDKWKQLLSKFEQTERPTTQLQTFVSLHSMVRREGIRTVVPHVELNVCPLEVRLSFDLVTRLEQFFAGDEADGKKKKKSVRASLIPESKLILRQDSLKQPVPTPTKKRWRVHSSSSTTSRSWVPESGDGGMFPPRKRTSSSQRSIPSFSEIETNEATQIQDRSISPPITPQPIQSHEESNGMVWFTYVRLGSIFILASFKGGQHMRTKIQDFKRLPIQLHTRIYQRKTCTVPRLLRRIRRDIILDLLSQTGDALASFLAYKLNIKRPIKRKSVRDLSSLDLLKIPNSLKNAKGTVSFSFRMAEHKRTLLLGGQQDKQRKSSGDRKSSPSQKARSPPDQPTTDPSDREPTPPSSPALSSPHASRTPTPVGSPSLGFSFRRKTRKKKASAKSEKSPLRGSQSVLSEDLFKELKSLKTDT
eukprot:956837_1